LAWLVNNHHVGENVRAGSGCEGKTKVRWLEMQRAIWLTIDDKSGEGTAYEELSRDCVAKYLADEAIANGNGYKPDCDDPNEIIPLVFVVDQDEEAENKTVGGIYNQVIMSMTPLHSIEGLCTCNEPGTCDEVPAFEEDIHGLPAETYSGNPNCDALGYDFGYKMEGCSSGSMAYDSLAKTQGGCDGGMEDVGSVTMVCAVPDGSQFKEVSITPDVDSVVIVKGSNGGVVYDGLKAGSTYTLDTGSKAAISHIEYCFRCDGPCPSRDIPTDAPVTDTPTASPTLSPTQPPVTGNPAPPKESDDEPCVDAPDVFDEAVLGLPANSYTDTPTCTDMGYSFGYKLTGCSAADDVLFESMELTSGTCDELTGLGDVDITCASADGSGGWKEAILTPSVDVVVKMDGPSGGVMYYVKGGETATLDVGDDVAVVDMEFCFMCNGCDGPIPTLAPTDAPAPDSPDDREGPTKPPGVKGDPHFKTFAGEMYDFHGECDLVLLHNPLFHDGKGMDVHIRTKIQDFWSSVETSALKIGDSTIEVQANPDSSEWLWINGELVTGLVPDKWESMRIEGMLLRYKETSPAVREITLYLEGHTEKLVMKTFKSFVRVDIPYQGSNNFVGSTGLLGAKDHFGQRLGRDGVTHLKDTHVFGQEWQVLAEEPQLFHSYEGAVVGQKCVMPPTYDAEKAASMKRRLAESGMTQEDAEKACDHLQDPEEIQACVFDVLATQDLDMASAW
jgi:hypothetical protein